MRRREVITLLGSVAVWPLAAHAQQPVVPVIGLLTSRGSNDAPQLLAAIRQGLQDRGFVEGQNVVIEYRFAENQNERLAALASDLVRRQVNLIVATTTSAAIAAKSATTTVPIVFEMGSDPIRLGLVANLNHPGGNLTGVTQLNVVVSPKRLEFLHELVPKATLIAVLNDPTDRATSESQTKDLEAAARGLGVEIYILGASTDAELEAVFAKVIQLRAGGLVIGGGAYFTARPEQLATLSLRHGVPTVYEGRAFVAAGGLMSYGGSLTDSYRQAGVYAARILKGEKPGDLPVELGTKVEMFLNLKTAKALGINVPLSLSGRANEVIE
jgi:putative tryptophan/tyrosine transport system substrate-binding protein